MRLLKVSFSAGVLHGSIGKTYTANQAEGCQFIALHENESGFQELVILFTEFLRGAILSSSYLKPFIGDCGQYPTQLKERLVVLRAPRQSGLLKSCAEQTKRVNLVRALT